MKKLIKHQASESFLLALLLAFVGGYLEAYTFFCRGEVFANAQTGNILFIGLNIGQGQYEKALTYVFPVLAFMVGVLIAESIRKHYQYRDSFIHWRQIIVLFEIFIMIVVAFIPMGIMDSVVNVAISFICSLQVESFRKVNGNAYASTMCTGNLRSGTEYLYKAIFNQDKIAKKHATQYFMIIILFVIGAIISMYLTLQLYEKSILVSAVILLGGFLMMFIQHQ